MAPFCVLNTTKNTLQIMNLAAYYYYYYYYYYKTSHAPTWTVVAIPAIPWFATTVKGTFGVIADGIVAAIVRAEPAFVYIWMIINFS